MSDVPRVGVIGAGRMCQRAHIPNLIAERVPIVAISDARHETAKLVAEHFRIPAVDDDWRKLVARGDIDTVVAALPDQFHAEVAIAALEARKHVFIEKPMATNREDAFAMVAAAKRAGRKLSIAYQRRHDPGAEIAERLVAELRESGELGRIRYAEFKNFGGDWLWTIDPLIDAGDTSPERNADPRLPSWLKSEYSGLFGVFNNGLTHGIDLLHRLVGPGNAVLGAWPEYGRTAIAVCEFGGIRTVVSSASTEGSIWQEWIEIRFERGWLRFSTPPALHVNRPGVVEVYRGSKGTTETYEAPHEWAFRRELQHFLRCVREGIDESPTPEEAARHVITVEEIFRCAAGMSPSRNVSV